MGIRDKIIKRAMYSDVSEDKLEKWHQEELNLIRNRFDKMEKKCEKLIKEEIKKQIKKET